MPRRRVSSGAAANVLWAANMALEQIAKYTPQLYHAVTVSIIGKPTSNLDTLYQFAMCVAAGVVQSMPKNSTHFFDGKINYQEKIVIVTIGFEASGLQTTGDDRDVVRLPVRDPVQSANFPTFIRKVPVDVPPVAPGSVILQSSPAQNPGLLYENSTRDDINTIANVAKLIDPTKSVPQPAVNATRSDLTDAQKQALKKLFGFLAS